MSSLFNAMMGAAGVSTGGYEVSNSAVFNDGDTEYLTRTPSGAGNTKIWTVSFWWRPGKITTASAKDTLFSARSANPYLLLQTNDNSPIASLFFAQYNGSGYDFQFVTDAIFRDPHAWYSIVIAVDTTQSTDTNRVKMYVNGSQATFGTASYPAQDLVTYWNTTYEQRIGMDFGSQPLDGYLAEWVNVDGSALAPTSFGEYDTNGVWRPKNVSGLSVGTNGFYLNFAASGSDLGDDASGSNDLTNTNSATQSGDSPTNNHCVWSPLTMNINASSSLALSSGNLVVSNTASEDTNVHGSFGVSSGKWYFEATVDTLNEIFIGWSDATIASNANAKTEAGAWVLDVENANKYNNDGGSSYGSAFSASDVANVALDLDNGKIWVGKDGTYPNSGAPASGTNPMYSGLSGTLFPFLSTQGGGSKQVTANFGQSAFTTSAPSGFEPLNTAKLYENAAPAIEDGTAYFEATLYQGNGTAIGSGGKAVNQSGNSVFKPDFCWIKNRDQGDDHMLYDAVRGATKDLHSNSNAAEATDTEGLSTFDSDGFTVGSNVAVNTSGEDYVAFQWKGSNTSGSTNGDGSIDSTVNVNTTAGFVVGEFTTPSATAAVRTVGHGLGGALDMLFVKNQASGHWAVWHTGIGNEYLRLNATDAKTSGGTEPNSIWNNTTPGSAASTFSIGTNSDVNGNNVTFSFIGFRGIPGYSAFGTYSGSGSSTGPFIPLDFAPSFFLQKRADNTGSWHIYDTARKSVNYNDTRLFADSNSIEYSNGEGILDILSNGIKIRDNETWFNASGGTYVYMAFAEHPFAGTTPATAR